QLGPEPRRGDHRKVPARARPHGLQVPVHHPGRLPRAELLDVRTGPRVRQRRHAGLRLAAAAGVRRGDRRLHRGQAPARGRHRLLRCDQHGAQPGGRDPGAARLDRGGAVRMSIEILGPMGERYDEILDQKALDFLVALDYQFAGRRVTLLDTRRARRARYATGQVPAFRPETAAIREDDSWRVAPPAPGLVDRRVEITGPTDRKMTVNALNSGAAVWLADFEDATSPTWANIIGGQLNLLDAVQRRIDFTDA